MWVKAPPARLRHESLSAHTECTRFIQGEAGMGAQSDLRCGRTLALTGSSHGETGSRKATYSEAGHNQPPPTSLELIPAELSL